MTGRIDPMDDIDAWEQAIVDRERSMWERRTEQLLAERDALREQNAGLIEMLAGIHGLLPPPPIAAADGKTYVFHDPNANETLRALRIRIAGITESVAAIRNAQLTAKHFGTKLGTKHGNSGAH